MLIHTTLTQSEVSKLPTPLFYACIRHERLKLEMGSHISIHYVHTHTQAYVHLARLERQRAEQEREREEAARKRKREEMKRIKRILEAAFDGDTQEIKAVLKEVGEEVTVECSFPYLVSVKGMHNGMHVV